jgi:hypothetical protein
VSISEATDDRRSLMVQRSALLEEVEQQLLEFARNRENQAKIRELDRLMQEEFSRFGGSWSMNPTDLKEFQDKVRPYREAMDDIERQRKVMLDRIVGLASKVRQYLVDCTIQNPATEALIDRADQLLQGCSSRTVQPDVVLLKLRKLLQEPAQVASESPSVKPPPSLKDSTGSGSKSPVPAQGRRIRGPNLEVSRERVKLWEKLSSELATIWDRTRGYTTVETLETSYPEFEIWGMISPADQRDLLNGEFKPRIYAGHLVLRRYGLTSLETLRKDRQKLRKAAP